MSDSAHSIHAGARPGTRRRKPWLARILHIFLYVFTAVFVLAVLLFAFLHTGWFRSILKDVIISEANSALNARLEIDDLQGNIFKGWDIRGVRLTGDQGAIVEVNSIKLRYNLLNLPWKRVDVRELVLDGPRIRIVKGVGLDWNIAHLVRDTTPSKPGGEFDWTVNVDRVSIINGSVLMYDSTTEANSTFSATHLAIDSLMFDCGAKISPAAKSIDLKRLSFVNRTGDVSLRKFSAEILLARSGTMVHNLAIRTDRSDVQINARMDSVDVLRGLPDGYMETGNFAVDLRSSAIDMRDLQYFLPALDILGSVVSLKLDAEGNLANLGIRGIEIKSPSSYLALNGSLKNITDGSDMMIDARLDGSVVDPKDLPKLLPGIPLPDYSAVGPVHFASLTYHGTPLKFSSEVDLSSGAGDAQSRVFLDITGSELVYDAEMSAQHADLARILASPDLQSSINISAKIRGRGVRPGRLIAEASVRLDSSRFQKWYASSASLQASAVSDSIRLVLDARSQAGSASIRTSFGFRDRSIGGFDLLGVVRNLDLARVTGNDSLRSDISTVVSAQGDGIDLSRSTITAQAQLDPGWIGATNYPADTINVELNQRQTDHRVLSVNSNYGSILVDGRFDIPRFMSWIGKESESMGQGLHEFALTNAPDSVIGIPVVPARKSARLRSSRYKAVTEPAADTTEYMNASVRLEVQSLRHLRAWLPHLKLLRGGYRGWLRGGDASMLVRGELALSDFYYIDTTKKTDILLSGLLLNHTFSGLTPGISLAHIKSSVSLAAQEFKIGSMSVNRLMSSLSMENNEGRFSISGRVDTTLTLKMKGDVSLRSHAYDIRIPALDLTYHGLDWKNESPIDLRVDSSAASINTFTLARNETRLHITGSKGFDGRNDIIASVDSLSLREVELSVAKQSGEQQSVGFSGTAQLTAQLTGTDDAPMMAADLFIPNLVYQGNSIGELTSEGRYDSGQLELFSDLAIPIKDGEKKKIFFVSGTIPVGKRETLDSAQADLRLQMKGFPLFLVERFVGLFDPLVGEANADLAVRGRYPDFAYSGYLDVHDAAGRFIKNNMLYKLDLRVHPEGRTIRIDTLLVKNDPADWSSGAILGKGEIVTKGFAVDNFNLLLNGKLKVLRRASRKSVKMVYGDLYASLGAGGLSASGVNSSITVAGDIIIEKGDLIFAMQDETLEASRNSNIQYIVVDDTSKAKKSSLTSGSRLSSGSLQGVSLEADADTVSDKSNGLLATNLSYDLKVATSGQLAVTMPFSSISQEELIARLRTDELRVSNASGFGACIGSVSLEGDSYLMFLGKRFKASGDLSFNGQIDNPDLDLRAVYSDIYSSRESNTRRKVYVIVTIKGNKAKPDLKFDMRWDSEDGEQIAGGSDSQSDAFSFILFGSFTGDLSGTERGKVLDQAQNLSNALTSSMVSAAASEFITRVGLQDVIKRIDIGGLGTQEAHIKVPIEIGRFVLVYDGKINSPGNSELVLEIPIGYGLIMATTVKTIDSSTDLNTNPSGSTTYEAKLLYRISF